MNIINIILLLVIAALSLLHLSTLFELVFKDLKVLATRFILTVTFITTSFLILVLVDNIREVRLVEHITQMGCEVDEYKLTVRCSNWMYKGESLLELVNKAGEFQYRIRLDNQRKKPPKKIIVIDTVN